MQQKWTIEWMCVYLYILYTRNNISGPFEVIMRVRTHTVNVLYQNEWSVIPYDDYYYDSVNFYLLLLQRIILDKWANILRPYSIRIWHTYSWNTHNQQNRIFIQMCNEKWQAILNGELMFSLAVVVINRWHYEDGRHFTVKRKMKS